MKKIILIILTLSFFKSMTLANEVNVFSARHYDSDIQLYKNLHLKLELKLMSYLVKINLFKKEL